MTSNERALLAATAPFSTLTPALLETATDAARLRTAARGAVVVREGEYGRSMFVILDGEAAVRTEVPGGTDVLLAVLTRGDVFGEMSVLTDAPRSATVVAERPLRLLELSAELTERLRDESEPFDAALGALHADRAVETVLRRSRLLAGVSDKDARELVLAQLAAEARLRSYASGDELVREGAVGDTLFVLRSGFVKVSKRHGQRERIVGYHTTGSVFGEMALLEDAPRSATVTAFTRVEAVEIGRAALEQAMARYPALEADVRRAAAEHRAATAAVERDPSRAETLEQLVEGGILASGSLLVIDLDVCIACDNCVQACQRRHGERRLDRHGTRLASVSLPVACRLCPDPVCLLCPYDGIRRAPSGEIYITDQCVGCTGCVRRCPYDVISMRRADGARAPTGGQPGLLMRLLDRVRPRQDRAGPSVRPPGQPAAPARPPSSGRSKESPRQASPPSEVQPAAAAAVGSGHKTATGRAVKCDSCRGYDDEACVQDCPVSAMRWVDPVAYFGDTTDVLRRSPFHLRAD